MYKICGNNGIRVRTRTHVLVLLVSNRFLLVKLLLLGFYLVLTRVGA